jgi:hypothetical protein
MKNERIITHFQSYTTAQGCVKDLTAYFSGKITVARRDEGANMRQDTPGAGENGRVTNEAENNSLLDEAVEMGGIALGAFAQVFPGFGPLMAGGPVVGARVGDVAGDYLEASTQRQADGDDNEDNTARQNPNLPRYNPGVTPQYVIAVDVNSEEGARLAIDIMQRHGGLVTRTSGQEAVGLPEDGNGQERQAEPRGDGYTLDPVAPVSATAFIDPNIGYGDYNLVDPDAFATNDLQGENAANTANRQANPNNGAEGIR